MTEKITIEVSGLSQAAADLARLARAAPGATARGLNEALTHARAELIRDARERYAVNEAGARHLDDLNITQRASSTSLAAGMRIRKMRNDLGYFETNPTRPLPGNLWRLGPRGGFQGHVLRSTAMKTEGGVAGRYGKAFLARFASGHVGMVERVLGSSSSHTATRSGRPRWRSANGKVEKVQTLGSPSAAAMISTVWPGHEQGSAEYFLKKLEEYLGRT